MKCMSLPNGRVVDFSLVEEVAMGCEMADALTNPKAKLNHP
jgi:hypothetical protein